jgi:N-acetylglucosaminyldiphosphoundecaprenol N-acetyl-beta-D-mannosaminyltransferase
MADVVKRMEAWIDSEHQRCHIIVATGMHGVMEGTRDHEFRKLLNSADLFVPDGFSLIWIARRRGFDLKRVTGSELPAKFCEVSVRRGYRNFFYGDTKRVLQNLRKKLLRKNPGLRIAGSYSPPFRTLTNSEDSQIVNMINRARPDVLWVALGLPRQERWMFDHRDSLKVPVMVGVGAAFGFLADEVKQAPHWVGDHGLEWAWRLVHQPKRVWRRVLFDIPRFLGYMGVELIHSDHSTCEHHEASY